jgi:hypothetical protein
MWRYTGAGNPIGSMKTKGNEAKYMSALRKISTVPFNSLDEGVLLYSPSGNPARTIS